jgi:hypothetical protein
MEYNTLTMTNREKIEQFLSDQSVINDFYYISEIDEVTFIYYVDFVNQESLDGAYDITVNPDDTITYIRHIRNAE